MDHAKIAGPYYKDVVKVQGRTIADIKNIITGLHKFVKTNGVIRQYKKYPPDIAGKFCVEPPQPVGIFML